MKIVRKVLRSGGIVVLSLTIGALCSSVVSADWALLDDFNRADSAVVGNGWTEIEYKKSTDPAEGDSTGAQPNLQVLNNTLQLEEPGTSTGPSQGLTHGNLPLGGNSIAEGTTGTLFFQFSATPPDPPEYYGIHISLSQVAAPDASTEGALMAINSTGASGWADPNPNQLCYKCPGGWDAFGPLEAGQLYNYWYVVDSAANSWDLYRNTGTGGATADDLIHAGNSYRNNTNTDFTTFMVRLLGDGPASNQANIDNIYVDNSGENLGNPVPEPATLALISMALVGLGFFRRSK